MCQSLHAHYFLCKYFQPVKSPILVAEISFLSTVLVFLLTRTQNFPPSGNAMSTPKTSHITSLHIPVIPRHPFDDLCSSDDVQIPYPSAYPFPRLPIHLRKDILAGKTGANLVSSSFLCPTLRSIAARVLSHYLETEVSTVVHYLKSSLCARHVVSHHALVSRIFSMNSIC